MKKYGLVFNPIVHIHTPPPLTILLLFIHHFLFFSPVELEDDKDVGDSQQERRIQKQQGREQEKRGERGERKRPWWVMLMGGSP